jgi:hypothetical protein
MKFQNGIIIVLKALLDYLFQTISISGMEIKIINGKYVRIWKQQVIASSKELSWHSPGKTEENHDNILLG